jgi:hypothetical protein
MADTLADVVRIARRYGLVVTSRFDPSSASEPAQRSCHCGAHQIARFGHLPGCPIRLPHIATREPDRG